MNTTYKALRAGLLALMTASCAAPTMWFQATGGACIAHGSSAPVDGIKPLTQRQYSNTILSLAPAQIRDSVKSELESKLADVPAVQASESPSARYSRFTRPLGSLEISLFWEISKAFAQSVTSDSARTQSFAGSCSGSSEACAESFVKTFGPRALRRPLNENEIQDFVASVKDVGAYGEKVRYITERMLMSPDFLFHLYVHGERLPGEGLKYVLNANELAQRLAFQFTDEPADAELLAAAQSGDLDTMEGYTQAVDALFARRQNDVKESMSVFFEEWFLSNRLNGFDAESAEFKSFLKDEKLSLGDNRALASSMKQELRDFSAHVVFDKKGSLADLFTDTSVYPQNPLLAQIYGTPVWTPGSEAPTTSSSERAGILGRAAFLASGDHKSHPFKRGARVIREVLCRPIGSPPDVIVPANKPIPFHASTRTQLEIKTSIGACMGCHASINPYGFALENFDALGQVRSQETLYDEAGATLYSTPVDAQVALPIDGEKNAVNGGAEMSQIMGSSPEVARCFAIQYVRFTKARPENAAADKCAVEAVAAKAQGPGGIEEALKAAVTDPNFRLLSLQE